MSLIRIALRIAAVEAIKGATLVDANVLDTPNGAIDIAADGTMRTDETRPFVAVYTDEGKAVDISGRSLVENGACVLVLEAGISAGMVTLDPDTGGGTITGIGIPASDSNFEFFLDVVQAQLHRALNDPDNPWAEIYRGLHADVLEIENGGRRNSEDGQRLAGHQTRIKLMLIDDPLPGEPIEADTPFGAFLTALEASDDTDYVAKAAKIRAVLAGVNEPWEALQRRHGLTRGELLALGRGPIAQDALRETPPLAEVTTEIDGNTPAVTP